MRLFVAFMLGPLLASCGGGAATEDGETGGLEAFSWERPRVQAVFALRAVPKLGPVLVVRRDARTVYRFGGDSRGNGTTHCYETCARTWRPIPSKKRPLGESGAFLPDDFGTMKRRDGSSQATYKGWPLYTHAGEGALGATGAGLSSFGGTWFALRANGRSVTDRAGGQD